MHSQSIFRRTVGNLNTIIIVVGVVSCDIWLNDNKGGGGHINGLTTDLSLLLLQRLLLVWKRNCPLLSVHEVNDNFPQKNLASSKSVFKC